MLPTAMLVSSDFNFAFYHKEIVLFSTSENSGTSRDTETEDQKDTIKVRRFFLIFLNF